MKMLDAFFNAIVIWVVTKRRGNVHRWETFSAIRWLFGRKVLREDYIEFTANRYAKNVREAMNAGYQPVDWRHLEESYWREELRSALQQPKGNEE